MRAFIEAMCLQLLAAKWQLWPWNLVQPLCAMQTNISYYVPFLGDTERRGCETEVVP